MANDGDSLDRLGRASCSAFAIAVLSAAVAWLILATMPQPTGGGEFRGVNDVGRAMLAMGLLLAGSALCFIGVGLGIAGLFKNDKSTNDSTIGLALNGIAAVASSVWWVSQ